MDLVASDYEIIDKRVLKPVQFPRFGGTLRPSQQEVYDQINDSCMLNAPVSYGKTFTALAIAAKLGQKTLIVTHTTMLRDQWIEEIDKIFGIEAGIIGTGKFNIRPIIVVGNVQTITKRMPDLSDAFGTIVLDECLDYTSQVDTLEHGPMSIGTIVNQELPVHVRSFDLVTNQEVYKKVLRFFKNKEESCLKIKHSVGSIKATYNHSFFIESKDGIISKVKAEDLSVGDNLILTNNRHKSRLALKESSLPIILGILLGDGNLSIANKANNSVRLRFTNGEAQLDYLLYKERLITSIISNEVTLVEGHSGYKVENKVYSLQTKSFEDSFSLYDKLYVSGHKKLVPADLANKLDVLAWSLIFQDDGSCTTSNVTFSFCELDEESIHNLGHSLINLNLVDEYYIYTCNRGFNYLNLNANNSRKFLHSIAKYIHPCMRYKLGSLLPMLADVPFEEHFDLIKEHIKPYYTRPIISIEPSTLMYGNRFNIEVEDTHTYFANGVLVSNCHHVSASTFSSILDKSKARYKIGLSGTLTRKDMKHVLFNDYFGFHVLKPDKENCMTPQVVVVETDIRFPGGKHWANKITELENELPEYRRLIVDLATSAASKGYKVLVVASRVEFLVWAAEQVPRAASITGQVKDIKERTSILNKIGTGELDVIFGTMSIFSEGISQNDLSCLILATPTNNEPMLTQLIGRIIREVPGKKQPLILDISLKGSTVKGQSAVRLGHYLKSGYQVRVLKK
jgi:superfamily II DNA or RNA helicase